MSLKKLKSIYKVLLLSIVLIIISSIIVIIFGNTYSYELYNFYNAKSIDDFIITNENPNIIELVDKRFDNNTVFLKVKSLSKGKAYLNVKLKVAILLL